MLAPLLTTAVAVCLLPLLCWALRHARQFNLDWYKIPLAKPSFPIIGLLPLYWNANLAAVLLKQLEEVGAPFMRGCILYKRVVVVADPSAAHTLLARSGDGAAPRKAPEYASFDLATGMHGHHSILTEQLEDRWVVMRKALSPAYGTAAIRANYGYVLRTYQTMCIRIAEAIARGSGGGGGAAGGPALAGTGRAFTAGNGSSSSSDDDVDSSSGRHGLTSDVSAAVFLTAAAGSTAGDQQGVKAAQPYQHLTSADVHIDHLALAAAIQLQSEGLFRLPPEKLFDTLEVSEALETVIGTVHHYPAQPWLPLLHLGMPWASKAARRMQAARQTLAACYQLLYHHVMDTGLPGEGEFQHTLGASLLRVKDPLTGKPFPAERILAEIGNQIMAPETAAHTLSWVLYCVATHPETERKVLAELAAAGLPVNGDMTAALRALEAGGPDMLQGLPYFNAVINEAMRMYPAGASASPRLLEKPTRVGPYMVPAGVMVFPCIYAINNWSGNWDEPRKFRPERWLTQPGDPDPALDPATGAPKFLPFSSGPKNCIGGALGMVSVRTGAALLLSTFRFSLAGRMGSPEEVEARTVLALTLKIAGGTWLSATQRA